MAREVNTSTEALIAHLNWEIEKLGRALYAGLSERRPGFSSKWSCSWRSWSEPRSDSEESRSQDAYGAVRPSSVRAYRHRCARSLPLLRIDEAIEAGEDGPNLLAMILFEKFGQHQAPNRPNDRRS